MKFDALGVLYVCADGEGEGLAMIDEVERLVNCNMAGDRQLYLTPESLAEYLDDEDRSSPFDSKLMEILKQAKKHGSADINIYC